LYGSGVWCGEHIRKKESINILSHNGLFGGIPNGTLFFESHHDFINVPEGFQLLANSQTVA
jgi:GMP synthase-like glutamine amidotransferase